MIANKAIFGLVGVGTLAAAWLLLPKDSKIKKAITDRFCQLTENLKERMSGMDKNVTAERVRNK